MENKFLTYQIDSYKKLVESLNYKFTSESNEYRLIEMVKSHIIDDRKVPILSQILEEKAVSNNNYFKINFSVEFSDIFYNADDFEIVATNFVKLYNAYVFYTNNKRLVRFYDSSFSFNNDYVFDVNNIDYLYNPDLSKTFGNYDFNFYKRTINSYSRFDTTCSESSIVALEEKNKNNFLFSETFKSILINQLGVKGLVPLINFNWNIDDTNKQIEFNKTKYDYDTKYITDATVIQENNLLIKSLLDESLAIKNKKSNNIGSTYIEKINAESIIKTGYKFYALSQLKDLNGDFVKTGVNIFLNKERTESAIVDGYDFYYAVMLINSLDNEVSCDICLDEDNDCIWILGNKTVNTKIQTGFDAATFTATFDYVDIPLSLKLPLVKSNEYSNIKVFNECWLFTYSASASLKEIIEFSKEEDDSIVKIKIPTDFLNQKDVVSKEQQFKIETIEEKINKSDLKGKDLLNKIVKYCEEYVLTYADKSQIEVFDEKGSSKKVTTYETKTNLKNLFLYDDKVNFDYVWKVNELFWKYNKQISIKELFAYFIAKGDKYNYRLLSYRILGVDAYTLKNKVVEQLLIEGLLCVENFGINVETKSIEIPLEVSYKYEYATGNYYTKRRKLLSTDENTLNGMSLYPMRESVILYFGDEIGNNIIQNQLSFLDSDLIRPKEMTWNSKSDSTKLLTSITDPIFIDDVNGIQQIKIKGSNNADLIFSKFNSFIQKTQLVNSEVKKRDILLGYIYRLPESVSIPLTFISDFNCYKIGVLPINHPLNSKGQDVFAVFGSYDLKNENPLFIGDDILSDKSCKDYIKSEPYEGGIQFKRKISKKGVDNGTYLFNKSLNTLTDLSYSNLYKGGFINEVEYNDLFIGKTNKKNIVNEILIAYNIKQSKVIMEGDYQFNKFMSSAVDEIDALKVQKIWNERYNYEMYPKRNVTVEGFSEDVFKLNNEKFPIFIEHSRFFGTESSKEFLLNDNQTDGIKFHVGNRNSSLLAHEVGFGKTSTSICSMSHLLLTGEANRIMTCVPNPVYVNFIREIKGEINSDGTSSRGLTPNLNIIELKNARKDVFIKYDKATYVQTGGVKKYTKNQIINIDSFKSVIDEISKALNPSKDKYNVIYIDDYSTYKVNKNEFISFTEKLFDAKLVDWRLESFFSDYLNNIDSIYSEYLSIWKDKIQVLDGEMYSKTNKISTSTTLTPQQINDKLSKLTKSYENKKLSKYLEICKEATIEILYTVKSSEQQIYDKIGVYEESFLQNNSIIICTHEAIGQLRINNELALKVSLELKDNYKFAKALNKNAIGFEKLNIDSIVVDEIHNFNEIFSFAKRQISSIKVYKRKGMDFRRSNYSIDYVTEYNNLVFTKKARGTDMSSLIKYNLTGKYTSTKKATLFGICKGLQQQKQKVGNYNIMLLSATPFVDDLYQMIGVFNMLKPFDLPISFFSNYLYQDWDWENDHKGETVLKVQTSTFKNDEARNNWIRLYSQFYTFDKRINANRPNKLTYPYDCKQNIEFNYKDNCDSNVYLDFTKEQFEIYENIGKYLEGQIGYENIVPSVMGKKIKSSVYILPEILDYVKELVDESNPNYSPESAVQLFVDEQWYKVLDNEDDANYKDVKAIYDLIEDDVQSILDKKEEEEEEEITRDEDEGQTIENMNDSESISGIGNDNGGSRALRGQDLGKKLALSPYMVTPFEANLGNVNPNLPELYGCDTPSNMLASAIAFVETSPKLYFAAKSIQSLVNYHIENNQDITGQIIYMAFGIKFIYGGVTYNGMDLLKAYIEHILDFKQVFTASETSEITSEGSDGVLSKELSSKEYKLSQVQVVNGAIQDPLYKSAISKSFNNGKIKVLIGSSTIKEGINLQGSKEFNHGNSTIYVVTSDYAPMVFMQLEGRVWRQGNPLENVRMVYPLIKNSIDLHIYSKLKEKITKVKNMLEAGVYNFKETQFEKDIDGVSLSLNSNINEKVKILWSKEERSINEKKKSLDSVKMRLESIASKYSNIKSGLSDVLVMYNAVGKALQDYYASNIMKESFSKERTKIGAKYSAKREELVNKLALIYDADLTVYETEKDKNEKLNEYNKSKKLPLVDFELKKPLKKDEKYQPDYTQLDLEQDNETKEIKEKITAEVIKNIEDKVYDEDEMYYYIPLNDSSTYSDINNGFNNLITNTSSTTIGYVNDRLMQLDSSIDVSGYYYAFDSKNIMLSYAMTKVRNSDLNYKLGQFFDALKIKLWGSVDNISFTEFLRLFVGGGEIEIILSDYQEFVYLKGKDISTINDLISEYSVKTQELNDRLMGKNDFIVKKREIYMKEEEAILKEREKLTNMKEYVMADVIKFEKTNKFIFMKGSLSDEQKKEMFEIKK